jgi:hypothetical protein
MRSSAALAFRNTSGEDYFAADVVATVVSDYAIFVAALTDSKTSSHGLELAYGRVLGIRGTLCRMCPSRLIWMLKAPIVRDWRRAEERLRESLAAARAGGSLWQTADVVETRWDVCAERLVYAAASGVLEKDIASHLGYLKAVDALALHMGQREIFIRSGSFKMPFPNPNGTKMRMRLISLHLALNSTWFARSVPAIRSFRETFGIGDPALYPWWFLDRKLTEHQSNWTHRRLASAEFGWRFE